MLSIYEAILDLGTPFRRPESGLQARFVKVLAQRVEARAEGAAPRSLTSFANLRGMSGVFLAGPAPLWLLAPDRGPVRAFAAHVYDVASFSSLSSTDYLIANSTGLHRYELPDLHYDRPVPWIGVVDGKSYAHVVYDSQSQTFICSGNYAAPFCLFDDEGMPLWEADATDLLGPETVRSSLELMIPGTWDVVDGCVTPPLLQSEGFRRRTAMNSARMNRSSPLRVSAPIPFLPRPANVNTSAPARSSIKARIRHRRERSICSRSFLSSTRAKG